MKCIILTKRGLTAITAVTLSALLIVFGICGRKSALSSAAAEEGKRLLPIYCVETGEKKVAVTFDAAWGADDTERLIEILKNHNAKATFFVVGEWAEKYPDSVKAFLCLRTRDRKSLCIAQYVFESYRERNHKRHNTL